jgi:hypothetical protein
VIGEIIFAVERDRLTELEDVFLYATNRAFARGW